MGKRIARTRSRSARTAALSAPGLLGIALLFLPQANAAGRLGLDPQDRIANMAGRVGMQDLTPATPVMIAANAEAQKARGTERVMGICLPTPYVAPGAEPNVQAATMAFPDSNARDYFSMYEKVELDLPPMSSVEIVKAPKHVKLVFDKSRGGEDALFFVPEPGYVGRDYAELQANVDGRVVKLAYFIHVTKADLNTPGARPQFCPKEPYWKISTAGSSLLDWQRSASLSALLADASQSFAGFQNLDGSSVGQTTKQKQQKRQIYFKPHGIMVAASLSITAANDATLLL